MTNPRKVAFISGASRAIGRTCAAELAAAGFDVAITSRSLHEGEEDGARDGALDLDRTPASLAEAAQAVEQAGARCLAMPTELSDPATVSAAVTRVLERWGRIDVVVHNGRYMGPGNMDPFLETSLELLRKQMEANLFAPLVINQIVLPQMISGGGGTVINMGSLAAYASPLRPAGAGGWGMGYAVSKGALQRVAGMLRAEVGDKGICCFNLQPGIIAESPGRRGAPPEVAGKVARWLCTSPEAAALNGQTIEAQPFCHERGLLPGWSGPQAETRESAEYDLAGYNLQQISQALREGSA